MKQILFLFTLFTITVNAQKIRFEYDDAGNQIQRKWCPSCLSRNSQETYKEVCCKYLYLHPQ